MASMSACGDTSWANGFIGLLRLSKTSACVMRSAAPEAGTGLRTRTPAGRETNHQRRPAAWQTLCSLVAMPRGSSGARFHEVIGHGAEPVQAVWITQPLQRKQRKSPHDVLAVQRPDGFGKPVMEALARCRCCQGWRSVEPAGAGLAGPAHSQNKGTGISPGWFLHAAVDRAETTAISMLCSRIMLSIAWASCRTCGPRVLLRLGIAHDQLLSPRLTSHGGQGSSGAMRRK